MAGGSIYRRVSVSMWGDKKFRSLSRALPNAQTLWQYLLTGPETTQVPGVITAGRAALAEALGWSVEDFDRVFDELEQAEMAVADWEARIVWLPNSVAHNEPDNPNVVKGWARVLKTLPDSELTPTIANRLYDELRRVDVSRAAEAKANGKPKPKQMLAEVFGAGFFEPSESDSKPDSKPPRKPAKKSQSRPSETLSRSPSETVPKQEQEQEQDQEQDQEPNPTNARAREGPRPPGEELGLGELERLGSRRGWASFGETKPAHVSKLKSLMPITRAEFELAADETDRDAAKPGFGFLVSRLEHHRKRANAPPRSSRSYDPMFDDPPPSAAAGGLDAL